MPPGKGGPMRIPTVFSGSTLTLDNGKEFSRFKEIEARTGLAVYFADPYAAWQRGTNENTNGLLRFYPDSGQWQRVLPVQRDRGKNRPGRLLCRSLCRLAKGDQ